jgi:EAL domain-containing protein (putative c-di-GMP-specific phosphodiesterase class I)/CheY-like chemotaxis protein
MSNEPTVINRRLLVIDDNKAIHEDFAKILCRETTNVHALAEAEAQIFGVSPIQAVQDDFQIDSAFQGEEGLAMVHQALSEHRPYAVAFIDVRMPPGWDGIETAARIWQIDPNLQIVICTAYSEYSWEQMLAKLGRSDRLVVLKKPFDNIEVQQLADALTRKWQRACDGTRHLVTLQRIIRDRSNSGLQLPNPKDNIGDWELALAAEAASTQNRRQLVLESELRHALDAGELSVQYQPLIDIATQKVVRIEALARWQKSGRWIPPGVFIPVAEASGLILELGEFVLKTACEQVSRWDTDEVPVVPVAVNVSAVQLERGNITELVRRVLQTTGLPAHLLALELTESALLENARKYNEAFEGLRSDGVSIEIDDFGTGYSSLSYLQLLPVDAIKIDRSFVRGIETNRVDAAIVSAIVAMAHSLGLRAVAEGVETAGQLKVLGDHGCDEAQGYYFSRPLTADSCRKLLISAAERQRFTDTVRLVAKNNTLSFAGRTR